MASITCLAWMKRGSAKQNPDRIRLDANELKELILAQEEKLQNFDLSSDEEDIPTDGNSLKRKIVEKTHPEQPENSNDENKFDDIVQKYSLENYDEEDDDNDDDIEDSENNEESSHPLSFAGISQFTASNKDSYITDDHDSDAENDVIMPEDNIIALGKVDGSFCNLEFYCYNEKTDNMYCHHDILLPSFPLAITWINYDPGENAPGNLVALGTMEPDIEIWDVDIMDSVAPVFVLKGTHKTKGSKKKKTSETGHTDAVLDLDWNSLKGNILASASADNTIGLWDLTTGSIASFIRYHEEKVQTLSWHPFEAQFLASGGYDCMAKIYDCRAPDDSHKSWKLSGEIERVIWNRHDPFYILASTDTGNIHYIDIRSDNVVFEWSAHKKAVSGLSLSNSIPGCLLTAGDKCVKIWDIRSDKPEMIMEKKLAIGDLGCAAASPDSDYIFAVGGANEMKVIKVNRHKAVREHFSPVEAASDQDQNTETNLEVSANNVDDDEELEALGLNETTAEGERTNNIKPKKKKKKKVIVKKLLN